MKPCSAGARAICGIHLGRPERPLTLGTRAGQFLLCRGYLEQKFTDDEFAAWEFARAGNSEKGRTGQCLENGFQG